jgi:hypothetical protein
MYVVGPVIVGVPAVTAPMFLPSVVASFTPGSLRATTAVSAVVPLWPNGLIVCHKAE